MKYFNIEGIVETSDNISLDDIIDEFINFIESKGWTFGGGLVEVDRQGKRIKS